MHRIRTRLNIDETLVADFRITELDGVAIGVELQNARNRHAVLTTGIWMANDSIEKNAAINMSATKLKEEPLIAPGGKRTVFEQLTFSKV